MPIAEFALGEMRPGAGGVSKGGDAMRRSVQSPPEMTGRSSRGQPLGYIYKVRSAGISFPYFRFTD